MISNVEGRLLKIVGLGFLAWLIPFVLSFSMFILREYYEPYYRAIMVLLGVLVVSILLRVYLPGSYEDLRVEGWFTAFIWLIIAVGLEAVFRYVQAPLHFDFRDYIVHQGWLFAYIPVICIVGGYLAHAIQRKHALAGHQTINFPRL